MAVTSYVSGVHLVGRFGNRLMAAGLGVAILGVSGSARHESTREKAASSG